MKMRRCSRHGFSPVFGIWPAAKTCPAVTESAGRRVPTHGPYDVTCGAAQRCTGSRDVLYLGAMSGLAARGPTASMETAEVRTAIDALRRIVRALRVSARAAEKRLGISAPQLFVLQQLADHARLSIGELARPTATAQS